MADGQELIFQQGITFAFGATHTYTLSKAEPVKAIIIRANLGAISGGASGSIIANTSVQAIKIRLNGKLVMDYDGLKNIAGQMSMGIATLREFYKQMHVVAMPDEHYIIEFPSSIPASQEIQVIFETAGSITALQTAGGDRDTLASSSLDVLYTTGKVGVKARVPYVSYTQFSHAGRTGFLDEFVPPTNLPLRKLMMITFDGTTISSTTYDSLVISEGSNVLIDGKLAYLRSKQGAKARVAQSTGHLHIGFPKGKNVKSQTLKFQLYAGTAGTAKFVHLAWLAL